MNIPTVGRGKENKAYGCMPCHWDDKRVLQYVSYELHGEWKIVEKRGECSHHSPQVLIEFEEVKK